MPDISALYPQPPQPQQNALMQNPLSLATTVSGLQTQALQRQQLQLAITNEMYKAVANGFGTLDPKSTADDVHSRAALLTRMYPNAAPIIGPMEDRIASHPNGIAHGISEAAIAANPERAAAPALGPPDPNTTVQPYSTEAGNVYAGSPAQTPLSTPAVAGAIPRPTTTYRAPATTLGIGAPESTQQMLRDKLAEGNFASDISPLKQALDKLKELPPDATGPGTESRQKFKAWLQSFSPETARALGFDPKEIADYNQLQKHLAAVAQSRAGALGAHTDQQVANTFAASPNLSLSDLAVGDLIKYQIGLRRMQNGLVNEAAKGGGPNYINAKSALAPHMDARAFMMDLMSPDQRNKLIQGLRGSERANFNRSLQAAYDHELLTRPPKNQPAQQ